MKVCKLLNTSSYDSQLTLHKIEVIVNAEQAVAAPAAKGLGDRIA